MKTIKIKEVFIDGNPLDFFAAEVSVRESGRGLLSWFLFVREDKNVVFNYQITHHNVQVKMISYEGEEFTGPAAPDSDGFRGSGKLEGFNYDV